MRSAGERVQSKVLTVKSLTSDLPRTSSTSPNGLPFGVGMVPRTGCPELSNICLTAWMKAWLKSSIFPISSITKTARAPGLACGGPKKKWEVSGGQGD